MKYLGSKSRIVKEIIPLILADRKEGQYFVEPFCGGCNVTSNVSGNRIASDYNEYLIAMFVGLLSGEKYPEQIRNISRQIPKLRGVEFRSGDYKSLQIPKESIVYCDPPL